MTHILRWSAVAITAITVASPKRADACSASPCSASHVAIAPGEGTVMPSNAPGVVARGDWGSSFPTLDLVGPDGQVVPTTRVSASSFDVTLALAAPLNPGDLYTVRASSTCPDVGRPDAGATAASASFTAGPASPLPTSMGTIAVRNGFAPPGPDVGGPIASLLPDSYYGNVSLAIAELHLAPAPGLLPYLPIVRFSTFVDDFLWSASSYGAPIADPPVTSINARGWQTVYASCGRALQTSACEVPGVAPGHHTVRVEAHVAGAASDPPAVEVAIDLQCPPSDGGAPDALAPVPWDGDVPETAAPDAVAELGPDAQHARPSGLDPADAAQEGGATGDALAPIETPPTAEAAACAFGHAPRGDSWSLVLLVAMGALLARARRRSV